MYNDDDDLVNDVREILADLGVDNVDDAPYEVLNEIGRGGYVDFNDLTDFADRVYG